MMAERVCDKHFNIKLIVPVLLLTLVLFSQGCSKKQINEKIVAIADEKKLTVQDNVQNIKQVFNIPNILRMSISPSGKKIAIFYGKAYDKSQFMTDPRSTFLYTINDLFPEGVIIQLDVLDLQSKKLLKISESGDGYSGASGRNPFDIKWSADSKNIFLGSYHNKVAALNVEKGKEDRVSNTVPLQRSKTPFDITNNAKADYIIDMPYSYYYAAYLPPDTFLTQKEYVDERELFLLKNNKILKKYEVGGSSSQANAIGKNFIVLKSASEGEETTLKILDSKTLRTLKRINLSDKYRYFYEVSPTGKNIMVYSVENTNEWFPKQYSVSFYNSDLKFLFKIPYEEWSSSQFIDDYNVDFRFVKINKEKKTAKNFHKILNLKTRKWKFAGNYRQIDWLTDYSKQRRILHLPTKGLKYYKKLVKGQPRERIK